MDVKELFETAEFDYVSNDLNAWRTTPYFYIPAGCWYMTNEDPEPQLAEEEKNIYMCGKGCFLKIIDLSKTPVEATCYYWFSSCQD